MNIANDVRGTIFNPEISEKMKNTVTGSFSTYEGKDKDGNSKYNSWIIHFVGKAFENAKKLQSKDQVKILKAKVENSYNKETEKLFVWVTAFSFEKIERKVSEEESEG